MEEVAAGQQEKKKLVENSENVVHTHESNQICYDDISEWKKDVQGNGEEAHELSLRKRLKKLEILVHRLQQPKLGVTIAEHRLKNVHYSSSIVAKDLVDWLTCHCNNFDRNKALKQAKEMVNSGFAILVEKDMEFLDADDCFLYWQVRI
jgi:hypothetical protein